MNLTILSVVPLILILIILFYGGVKAVKGLAKDAAKIIIWLLRR